ncbi:MAG: HNH endonuclease [Bacteriovoracaceae bacterium]
MNSEARNLLENTEILVKNEKEFTVKIVKNLVEIDRRKLYVEIGFNSLFTYCRDHLKYSEPEAIIRVNAVRLIKNSLLAEIKLESRELSLTTAADLYIHLKKCEFQLSLEEKNRLIEKICNQPSREAKKIIQAALNLVPEIKCEVILKKSTVERLEKLKERLAIRDNDLLLNCLMQEKEDSLFLDAATTIAQLSPEVKRSRYIPINIRRKVFKKSNYQCEFIQRDGVRCSARVNLQIEHIKPYSLGGSHAENNLQILCATHNQYNALKIFGYKAIS